MFAYVLFIVLAFGVLWPCGVGLVALVFGLFVKILLLPGCCVLAAGCGYVLRCWRLKFAVARIRLLF